MQETRGVNNIGKVMDDIIKTGIEETDSCQKTETLGQKFNILKLTDLIRRETQDDDDED